MHPLGLHGVNPFSPAAGTLTTLREIIVETQAKRGLVLQRFLFLSELLGDPFGGRLPQRQGLPGPQRSRLRRTGASEFQDAGGGGGLGVIRTGSGCGNAQNPGVGEEQAESEGAPAAELQTGSCGCVCVCGKAWATETLCCCCCVA